MKTTPPDRALPRAFSLVETVVAIGIFTFVIVGILGLFPTAMRQHANAARENLGVQAAQQIMASIVVATNLSNVNIAIGYGNGSNRPVNLLNTNLPLVLGFRKGSSVPVWNSGMLDTGATEVDTLVRVTALSNAPSLYQINIDVVYPAAVPEGMGTRETNSFSTMVCKP